MLDTLLDGWRHTRDRQTVIHECARCGTTLETQNDSCPYCEDTRVATFEL